MCKRCKKIVLRENIVIFKKRIVVDRTHRKNLIFKVWVQSRRYWYSKKDIDIAKRIPRLKTYLLTEALCIWAQSPHAELEAIQYSVHCEAGHGGWRYLSPLSNVCCTPKVKFLQYLFFEHNFYLSFLLSLHLFPLICSVDGERILLCSAWLHSGTWRLM